MENKPKNKKSDFTNLLDTKLPLTKKTYDELRKALWNGNILWKDMSPELSNAYQVYWMPEREKKWQKQINIGIDTELD